LIPELGEENSARLYSAFLKDRINQVKSIENIDHIIAYTPKTSEQYFESLIPPGFKLIPQHGPDLGARLDNVFSQLFSEGHKKVIIIDSDSPNLPIDYIISGFKELDNSDIVIGPCDDGGYYLIGLKYWLCELFSNIPWSTEKVTSVTVEKAVELEKKISMLKEWYDVDIIDDLKRLRDDLNLNNANEKKENYCINTVKAMTEILK
jgi:rSAM/selenodomain-associated transferase 1